MGWPPHRPVAYAMSILIADDDALLRALIVQLLEAHGLKGEEAESCEDAIARLARKPRPLAVVLDVNMPKIGGLATLALIREKKALEHLPVIMLTAQKTECDVLSAELLGATAFVAKPFQPKRLVGLLREVIRASTCSELPV